MSAVRYPFSAVVGMDYAKRAIMCAAVNPALKTVLIRGDPGSAKTTLARSAVFLFPGRSMVNIPQNVSPEALFGGLDVEKTMETGEPRFQSGLMGRADGNIAYIDDVNLLEDGILASVTDAVYGGSVRLEREGASMEYACDTVVIATMNPDDSDISDHMLDRFCMCAYSTGVEDQPEREEIVHRNMRFCASPRDFMESYAEADAKVEAEVSRAREILPCVTISDELLMISVELCGSVDADGHRGDIALVNTAMALAALNGRDEVSKYDVERAAALCLPHRRNYRQPPEGREEGKPPEDSGEEPPQEKPPEDGDDETDARDEPQEPQEGGECDRDETPMDIGDMEDMLFEIGDRFRVTDYLGSSPGRVRRTKSVRGRREMAESRDSSGTYVGSRIPEGRTTDIAFDATVRAAAPYQRDRDKGNLAINIAKSDIRMKVKHRRSGCTILFLVDASGSLGVKRRMSTVKGAIFSMLRDSYVKRDRIGMMAFRRDASELVLPPTKSVEYSYSKLEEMPTGGKTPLSAALVRADEFMTSYSRTHPGEKCYVVLITDGRANVPLTEGRDANEEVLEIADKISIPGVRWVVVDASTGFVRFDNAEVLSRKLSATYLRLEDLNADALRSGIKALVG